MGQINKVAWMARARWFSWNEIIGGTLKKALLDFHKRVMCIRACVSLGLSSWSVARWAQPWFQLRWEVSVLALGEPGQGSYTRENFEKSVQPTTYSRQIETAKIAKTAKTDALLFHFRCFRLFRGQYSELVDSLVLFSLTFLRCCS